MKILRNMSVKSLAASAAVLLLVSSAAYATCQQDCAAYAQTEAQKVKVSVYSQVFQSCSQAGGNYNSCNPIATTNAQNAYNGSYTYYYSNCTASNCGG